MGGEVEACRSRSIQDSFLTLKTCAGSALNQEAERFSTAVGASHTSPPPNHPIIGGQTMMLVLTPVRDVKWDAVIFDEHGRRWIVDIVRDYNRAYITFNTGPSGWYLDAETLPVEMLS